MSLRNVNSNFALTLGYLNPALHNPAKACVSRKIPFTDRHERVFALFSSVRVHIFMKTHQKRKQNLASERYRLHAWTE